MTNDSICKFIKGEITCSFLVFSVPNLECAKNTSLQKAIIERKATGVINARGDGCEGRIGCVDLKDWSAAND